MTLPVDVLAQFEKVIRQVDRVERGQGTIKRSLRKLQTMVVGHYEDVNKFARMVERRVDRIEQRLGLPPIEPEPPPRALPDPP